MRVRLHYCAIEESSHYEILSRYPSLTTRSRAISILLDTSFNRDLVIVHFFPRFLFQCFSVWLPLENARSRIQKISVI